MLSNRQVNALRARAVQGQHPRAGLQDDAGLSFRQADAGGLGISALFDPSRRARFNRLALTLRDDTLLTQEPIPMGWLGGQTQWLQFVISGTSGRRKMFTGI